MTEYIVPYQNAESEFTEKRSRFITHLYKVETEAEARARIEEMKKKYYDARHNCWCYLLQEGGVVRYSDDGEPQGTAGQPMLNVFQRQEVWNVCCVVTRYFGGVLLGAGGLTRAYTKGAADALTAARDRPDGALDAMGRALHLSAAGADEAGGGRRRRRGPGRGIRRGHHPPDGISRRDCGNVPAPADGAFRRESDHDGGRGGVFAGTPGGSKLTTVP